MRKLNLVGFALLLVLSFGTVCSAKVTEQSSSVPASAMSQIQQTVGETDAYMGPTRFPVFQNMVSTDAGGNPVCVDQLNKLSFTKLPANLIYQTDYVTVDGLKIENLAIPAANRKTTKMLVTWTIRVEGGKPAVKDPNCDQGGTGYKIYPCFCPGGWHGSTDQIYKGGPVNSKLYINDIAVGNVASMTMPDADKSTVTVTQIYDPTISGSFLITKDFFPGGIFPAKIDKLEVKWYNDTAMKIKSPANTRMIVITVMPITSSLSETK